MKLSKVLFLFLYLTLSVTVMPSISSADAKSTSVSLSDVKISGPDYYDNYLIEGDVTVTGIYPDTGVFSSELMIYRVLSRNELIWPPLLEGYDAQRKCYVIDDICIAWDETIEGGFPSIDVWYRTEFWSPGGPGTPRGLTPRDEGKTFPFTGKIKPEDDLKRDYNYMKFVAKLKLRCYAQGDDCPLPEPLIKQYFWDESSVFDLKNLGSDSLNVKLEYLPVHPKPDENIRFVATTVNPGDILTYEWYVKEQFGIEKRIPSQITEVYQANLNEGSYTVRVKVYNTAGQTAEDKVSFTVGINHPPTVKLVCSPADPRPGDYITITAEAEDKDGDDLTYRFFNLFDGKEIGKPSLWDADVHRYKAERELMKVMVIVSDGKGGVARAWHTLLIDTDSSTIISWTDSGLAWVNGKEWPVGVERKLSENDRLGTSPSGSGLSPGYASLKSTDGTQVRIRPGTSIEMGSKGGFISLDKGGLWGHVPGSPENVPVLFTLTSPSAIGTVKGTEFGAVVEDDGTTIFYVFEGVVDVFDIDMRETVSVNAGMTTMVEPDGVPSDPEPFDTDSIDRWWESFPFDTIHRTTDVRGLTFESRSKSSGSSVQIPLTLSGIKEKIGNMDITLSYDPSILEAKGVIKGGLTANSIFDYNIPNQGTIKVSMADKEGFNGDGSIAYVKFNVIGSKGSSSPLQIAAIAANRAEDEEALEIPTIDGVFRVISMEEGRGDSDGDGEYTALDALCILQMAVEKIPEDLVMDVNGDGSVTSIDARKILRIAVGIESK
jgi:hypothetical protein